jgi:hypothetical protein
LTTTSLPDFCVYGQTLLQYHDTGGRDWCAKWSGGSPRMCLAPRDVARLVWIRRGSPPPLETTCIQARVPPPEPGQNVRLREPGAGLVGDIPVARIRMSKVDVGNHDVADNLGCGSPSGDNVREDLSGWWMTRSPRSSDTKSVPLKKRRILTMLLRSGMKDGTTYQQGTPRHVTAVRCESRDSCGCDGKQQWSYWVDCSVAQYFPLVLPL